MEIKIQIPDYKAECGITYIWEDNFEIQTKVENGEIIIQANRDGLISLANHFLNLAQDGVPNGHHMHFDEFNSLEKGSKELIVIKK
ncbi:hypothetical protein AWW67_03110 [Roseivirga seohaensis]|uniref:Uncharacterized protein n=1 Tax=Roseivirga seohaensis TaxID=1914963 RepID=A0A150XZT2_9BACT|nr:hypothetical protein [Roseivirga seohaensis]KYG84115.1 hypothetical protein AWW67_03110 [Roseivirga seohaensis]